MRRCLLLLLAAATLGAQASTPPSIPTAQQLIREGKFGDARALTQARLDKNKNDADAMFWMGRAYEAQEKFGDASDWFEKAIRIEPGNAVYHLWLGNAKGDEASRASKVRQPFLARKVKAEFEKAVELDPTLIDAREGLVGFYSQAPGFMGGSMDKARQQAAEIAKLSPYRGQLASARIARQERDTAAEEKAYKGAIAAAPDSINTYVALAALYRRALRWDDAFATYEQVMKVKPDEPVAHLGWGAVAVLSGKSLDRGERELKHFLGVATVEKQGYQYVAGGHFRLGQLYERTNRKDLAKAEYSEALRIHPQHPDAKKALDALK